MIRINKTYHSASWKNWRFVRSVEHWGQICKSTLAWRMWMYYQNLSNYLNTLKGRPQHYYNKNRSAASSRFPLPHPNRVLKRHILLYILFTNYQNRFRRPKADLKDSYNTLRNLDPSWVCHARSWAEPFASKNCMTHDRKICWPTESMINYSGGERFVGMQWNQIQLQQCPQKLDAIIDSAHRKSALKLVAKYLVDSICKLLTEYNNTCNHT